ncbi:DUF4393 domain-containing protein [Antrihabitans cavernicola]|uniref:DUF4393 domain-containing protein n=2 Tax=Antrihabitans cavernicola TaxID=2495913 RepID=A0A5A7SI92_9NOCA|nr:DUF4393 domain-containing protein [Spelaeibacter cavernicola]
MDVVRATPGLARVAITSFTNIATWGFRKTTETSSVVVRRTLDGDAPQAIVADISQDVFAEIRSILGLGGGGGSSGSGHVVSAQSYSVRDTPEHDLKARGAALLRRSADVNVSEDGHPAYSRILSEIAPDEARILRFLYLDGPQPSIDIRTGRPLGIGSELVEGGLNMIGEHAGLTYPDRIHPYLTNLNRLGMVEFSKETVSNPTRYQLVEAQPRMAEVTKRAGFAAKAIQRSIQLTTFGEDFVAACLPVGEKYSGR